MDFKFINRIIEILKLKLYYVDNDFYNVLLWLMKYQLIHFNLKIPVNSVFLYWKISCNIFVTNKHRTVSFN